MRCPSDPVTPRWRRERPQTPFCPEQIDDPADQGPPDTQSCENFLVFGKDLFRHKPDEGCLFKPIAKKRSAGVRGRAPGFEAGDSRHKN